jgi:hypothetical protein
LTAAPAETRRAHGRVAWPRDRLCRPQGSLRDRVRSHDAVAVRRESSRNSAHDPVDERTVQCGLTARATRPRALPRQP